MAMNRRRKICIALAVVLLAFFIVLPMVLGGAMRGKIEAKIGEATKAPVKLGGLSVKLLPPGAVLSNLEVGETVAEAGGAPLAKIGTLKVGVTWGTVFGGAVHVTSLKASDADVVLACDEKGRSNLQWFLDNMGPSERKVPLPIDSLVVKDAKITCFVSQKLVAPKSKTVLEPTTIEVGYLGVDDIVIPPPGQPAESGQWMTIAAERVKASAPLRGVEVPASPAEAGPALAEGLQLDELQLELALPTANEVMRIRDGSLSGLRLRNVLHAPQTPETLQRIHVPLVLSALGAAKAKAREGSSGGTSGLNIEELQARDSILEIAGPDAKGNLAYYRLTQLDVNVQDFGWGPGAGTREGKKGLVRVTSPSKSVKSDGQLLVEWTNIEGRWPQLSFDTKEELSGLALAPFSMRVEQSAGAAVEGSLDTAFAGPTRNGAIKWDGTVTLSKDTKLIGKSTKGKFMSGMSDLTSGMTGLATGKPIEGFGVRGTLDNPKYIRPDVVPSAIFDLGQKMASGQPVSFPDIIMEGTGDIINKGVEGGTELIKKVPGLGDLFKK